MPDELTEKPEVRIQVNYRPGRRNRVFHIFDVEGGEVKLTQRDALKTAHRIIRIAKEV